jgi:hypothetical protein
VGIIASQKRRLFEIYRFSHTLKILNKMNADVMHKMHARKISCGPALPGLFA